MFHRLLTWLVALVALAGASGCGVDPVSPPGAPYLAVVVLVDAPPEVTTRGPYGFRVRELSGTLKYDTTFLATPRDTIILSVKPATYLVEIAGVPPSCGVRAGNAQLISVLPKTNTSLARFSLACRNAVTLIALTDGNQVDSSYIYTLSGPNGALRGGTLAANDTLLLDDLAPGEWLVSLRHVAPNCQVLSDGGENVAFTLGASGGRQVAFRVACSELGRRPRITRFGGSFAQGSAGFVLFVADPDRDVERYVWDITDCNRRSLLPGGALRRGGFSGWENVSYRDTAVVIGAFDLPLSDAQLQQRCQLVYVGDERGNYSEILEIPIPARRPARAPTASNFNGRYLGTAALQVSAQVADPEGDYVGAFVFYTTRDGIVSTPPDGQPDRVVFQSPGILGSEFPDLPFGIGYGVWSDYLSVTVFLVDREGNFTRLDDTDLFR